MRERRRDRLYKDGEEQGNPVPRQPPLGYKRQPSLSEQVRQMVVLEKIRALQEMEETEEEADDFEVGDDYEPLSKYENDHMPSIAELKRRAQLINEQIEKQKLERLKNRLDAEGNAKRGQPGGAGGGSDKSQSQEPPPVPEKPQT